jgi:hypothetical protein
MIFEPFDFHLLRPEKAEKGSVVSLPIPCQTYNLAGESRESMKLMITKE